MEKVKWMIIAVLLVIQAQAQVISTKESQDKTVTLSFRTVYETHQYYNDLEESIELKYANLKVPVFEKMEGPQDSLWVIDEQISTLRELIRMEEFSFISWEKSADRDNEDFQKERTEKQQFVKNEIMKMRKAIDELEVKKPVFVRALKDQEIVLIEINKLMEKELDQVKEERQSALVRMYRA